jgi:hypothetical protein
VHAGEVKRDERLGARGPDLDVRHARKSDRARIGGRAWPRRPAMTSMRAATRRLICCRVPSTTSSFRPATLAARSTGRKRRNPHPWGRHVAAFEVQTSRCNFDDGRWSQPGSNRRPLACHASALPAELWPLEPGQCSREIKIIRPVNPSGLVVPRSTDPKLNCRPAVYTIDRNQEAAIELGAERR